MGACNCAGRPQLGLVTNEAHNGEFEDGDLVTTDRVHFERRGRLVLTIQARVPPRAIGEPGVKWRDADLDEVSESATWAQVERFLRKKRLRVNVWLLDARGDYELMRRPARHRRQTARARARLLLAVAAAERRYGEDHEHW